MAKKNPFNKKNIIKGKYTRMKFIYRPQAFSIESLTEPVMSKRFKKEETTLSPPKGPIFALQASSATNTSTHMHAKKQNKKKVYYLQLILLR